MRKEIKFEDETIRIDVHLNVDHSDFSGMLHKIELIIPTFDENLVYRSRLCPEDMILEIIEEHITIGKDIIIKSKNEKDIVDILKDNGFKTK